MSVTRFLAFLLLLVLPSCQSSFIYFPRPYDDKTIPKWSKEPATRVIHYTTRDGSQQAYLLSQSAKPEHLWIVCGGNGTLALEWSDFFRKHGSSKDAWLILDMPGYGACQGIPSPQSITRTVQGAIPAATAALRWSLPVDSHRLRFCGHSLGCAVVLIAAKEYDIRRGVLLAPFTSTMDMAKALTGLPLGFMVHHRYDNLVRLREIEAKGGGCVCILHGGEDGVIPIRMSRELQAAAPHTVHLAEVPKGGHNDLQELAIPQIETALRTAAGR